jgi:hemoglobin/transferrin/lactoferrin receptor protein
MNSALKSNLYLCIFLLTTRFYSYAQIDSVKTSDLQQFVLSVNRFAEDKNKIANQILQINPEKISFQNAATTADLLGQSSGITIQRSQQAGGSPILRGFEANRILLTVDGIKLNNLIYRGGHLQNLLTVEQHTLSSVEVEYGPSSTLYGSGALGGSIHLFTKNPEFDNRNIQIRLRHRNLAQKENQVGLQLNFGRKKWAYLSVLNLSTYSDLQMGKRINKKLGQNFGLRDSLWLENPQNNFIKVKNPNPFLQKSSAYEQADILQKIIIKPDENQQHKINYQYSTSGIIPRYDRLTNLNTDGTLKYKKWYYGPQKRRLLAYNYNLNVIDFEIDITLSQQNVQESRHELLATDNYLKNRTENVNIWAFTTQINKTKRNKKIRYGFDSQWNNLKSEAFQSDIQNNKVKLPLDTRYPDGGSKMSNFDLFVSETTDVSNKIKIIDGLRVGITNLKAKFVDKSFFSFPYHSIRQNNITYSGHLGFIYFPKKTYKISANISTGFRVPNIDDLAKVFDSGNNNIIVPNVKIKAEKTINYEIGISKIEGVFTFENYFYFSRFKNALVLGDFKFNGADSLLYNGNKVKVLAMQNLRKANIVGMSSTASCYLSKRLLLIGHINILRGQILKEKQPLDHIPPAHGRIALKYNTPKVNQEIYMLWNSTKPISRYNPNGEDNQQYAPLMGSPNWQTLNYRIQYKASEKAHYQAGIDNILDMQYRGFASGINAPGRNIYVSCLFQIGERVPF